MRPSGKRNPARRSNSLEPGNGRSTGSAGEGDGVDGIRFGLGTCLVDGAVGTRTGRVGGGVVACRRLALTFRAYRKNSASRALVRSRLAAPTIHNDSSSPTTAIFHPQHPPGSRPKVRWVVVIELPKKYR
eukprot:Hpha_TRINITY_DN1758_c0_g1::TRINITY_DN1758_c0_g1_i1::g.158403::m.158403